MNLTEYQMDRLADAHSNANGHSPVSHSNGRTTTTSSPHKSVDDTRHRVSRNPEKSPSARSRAQVTHKETGDEHINDESRRHYQVRRDEESKRCTTSTTFSDLMPPLPNNVESLSATIAERRRQNAPNQIAVDEARKYGTFVRRARAVPAASHPLNHSQPLFPAVDESWSSVYSQEDGYPAPHVAPLAVEKGTVSRQIDDVLQTYNDWKGLDSSSLDNDIAERRSSPVRTSPARARSPGRQRAPSPRRAPKTCNRADELKQTASDNDSYSPLVTYFAFEGLPIQKIGGKTLIGEQGWLKRPNTHQTPERRKKDVSPKKAGLLDSIKKMAKGMTEAKASRRPREPEKETKTLKLTISLDPREQSLLYCELEFQVSNAIHAYITNELSHGRLDTDKLKMIADSWNGKGRPRVVGFRYDLETQLELINLHLTDFRFFGRRQGNPLEIAGLLHAMKVNARAMRIRTFCQPDSVIAKQLVDSQSLFNTIGCSNTQQVALAEIAQFFKVIVERERSYRNHLVRLSVGAQPRPHDHRDHCHWENPGDEEAGAEGHSTGLNIVGSSQVNRSASPAKLRGSE
ncbi:hypothetical protein ACHAQA_004866 [Verticillium albo-atrum]